MAEKTVDYEPVRGAAVSAALLAVPDDASSIALMGGQLSQGALTTLLRAELLAAQAGIVPFVDLGPPLGKAVITLGAARDRMGDRDLASLAGLGGPFLTMNPTAKGTTADERFARLQDVRTVYLASQGAVRRAGAFARPAKDATPRIVGHDLMGFELEEHLASLGILPILVVAMVVVGVAAIAATAWWAVKYKEADIELDAQKARAVAATASLADLARAQIAAGQPVDPAIVEALGGIGRGEKRAGWAPYVLGAVGATIIGGGGYLALRHQGVV